MFRPRSGQRRRQRKRFGASHAATLTLVGGTSFALSYGWLETCDQDSFSCLATRGEGHELSFEPAHDVGPVDLSYVDIVPVEGSPRTSWSHEERKRALETLLPLAERAAGWPATDAAGLRDYLIRTAKPAIEETLGLRVSVGEGAIGPTILIDSFPGTDAAARLMQAGYRLAIDPRLRSELWGDTLYLGWSEVLESVAEPKRLGVYVDMLNDPEQRRNAIKEVLKSHWGLLRLNLGDVSISELEGEQRGRYADFKQLAATHGIHLPDYDVNVARSLSIGALDSRLQDARERVAAAPEAQRRQVLEQELGVLQPFLAKLGLVASVGDRETERETQKNGGPRWVPDIYIEGSSLLGDGCRDQGLFERFCRLGNELATRHGGFFLEPDTEGESAGTYHGDTDQVQVDDSRFISELRGVGNTVGHEFDHQEGEPKDGSPSYPYQGVQYGNDWPGLHKLYAESFWVDEVKAHKNDLNRLASAAELVLKEPWPPFMQTVPDLITADAENPDGALPKDAAPDGEVGQSRIAKTVHQGTKAILRSLLAYKEGRSPELSIQGPQGDHLGVQIGFKRGDEWERVDRLHLAEDRDAIDQIIEFYQRQLAQLERDLAEIEQLRRRHKELAARIAAKEEAWYREHL